LFAPSKTLRGGITDISNKRNKQVRQAIKKAIKTSLAENPTLKLRALNMIQTTGKNIFWRAKNIWFFKDEWNEKNGKRH